MALFRFTLIVMLVALTVYTAVVIGAQGANFLPYYFRDLFAVQWPGQFDLDFSILLMLAGIWAAWRNRWSPTGIVIGLLIPILGAMLLVPYLLYLSFRHEGETVAMAIGERRAA